MPSVDSPAPPISMRCVGPHKVTSWPNNRCQTSYWQEGDYIVDRFKVEAGDVSSGTGRYTAWVGFFVGSSGNWKNMKISAAPPGGKDDADRVKLGTIIVQ